VESLDKKIINAKYKLLTDKGHISHEQTIEKAEKEFEIYRERELKNLISDFDRLIEKTKKSKK